MPPLRTESYYPPPRTLPPTQGHYGCSEGGGKGRSSIVGIRPPDGDVHADADGTATGTAGADGAAREYVLCHATTGSVGSSDARAATTNATFANAATTRTL